MRFFLGECLSCNNNQLLGKFQVLSHETQNSQTTESNLCEKNTEHKKLICEAVAWLLPPKLQQKTSSYCLDDKHTTTLTAVMTVAPNMREKSAHSLQKYAMLSFWYFPLPRSVVLARSPLCHPKTSLYLLIYGGSKICQRFLVADILE